MSAALHLRFCTLDNGLVTRNNFIELLDIIFSEERNLVFSLNILHIINNIIVTCLFSFPQDHLKSGQY